MILSSTTTDVLVADPPHKCVEEISNKNMVFNFYGKTSYELMIFPTNVRQRSAAKKNAVLWCHNQWEQFWIFHSSCGVRPFFCGTDQCRHFD